MNIHCIMILLKIPITLIKIIKIENIMDFIRQSRSIPPLVLPRRLFVGCVMVCIHFMNVPNCNASTMKQLLTLDDDLAHKHISIKAVLSACEDVIGTSSITPNDVLTDSDPADAKINSIQDYHHNFHDDIMFNDVVDDLAFFDTDTWDYI